jgi:serine/threonine protein kinase
MRNSYHPAELIARALAEPRPAPKVDLSAFLKNVGLFQIHGYTFSKLLSGGGTNLTALYVKDNENVVAKFFFTGPTGAGDAHCDRELKMLSMVHSQETVLDIKVVPRVIEEFSSADNMIVGFLMDYIQGETLADVMSRIVPGDFNESITTITRVGWARHNAFRASISHKDLHPGNIIFEMNNKEWEQWIEGSDNEYDARVRILDLGSAVMPMQFSYDDGFDEGWYQDLIRYFNGAFTCVAPEFFTKDFLRSLQGSQSFDCWALGHILYKMYTGKNINLATSVGQYCELIYRNRLENEIRSKINANVKDSRMSFLISSMLAPDYKKRVSLFSAIAYANLLRQKHPKVANLEGNDLYRFVYIEGADLESHLPPHERSNSPY